MKHKTKRTIALLLAFTMVFSFASMLGACGEAHQCGHICEECGKCTSDCTDPVCADKCEGHEEPAPHECKHVCPECGKCTDATCTDPVCADKCEGHEEAHVCGHVCEECGKCTDATCQDPVCAEKCEGHEDADPSREGEFTPITAPVAGKYYMGMKCSGDVYYYVKGGMNGFYMATSANQEEAAVVTLIEDGDGWLLKLGEQYMEIELSGTHVNAVYKSAPTEGKHWTWDSTYNIFTWENGKYFYGTYGTYNTVGGGDYAQHASDNYKAQLGLFTDPNAGKPAATGVTLDKTGKLYLSLQSGSYIQLTANVQPTEASQEVVWASSNEQAATVANGKVTCVGAGETTISATVKDTSFKAEVTVKVPEKGSRSNPLSVNEAIALMDEAGDGVTLGDANNKFYFSGVVEDGSTISGGSSTDLTNTKWAFNLLGTDGKKFSLELMYNIIAQFSITPQNGALDGYTLVLRAYLTKNGAEYTLGTPVLEIATRPALTGISIEETLTLDIGASSTLQATPVPANAQIDLQGAEWKSDNAAATVDGTGKVTGASAGTAHVTVKVGSITSNVCTVTVNSAQANIVEYDWSKAVAGGYKVDTACDVETTGDILSYINIWSPEQTEITAISVAHMGLHSQADLGWSGIGYDDIVGEAGSISMTTTHAIKKVTLKLIPFTTSQMVKLSVNGKEINEQPNGWTGTYASAFERTVVFDEASNTITINVPNEFYNQFVIAGMTLEY